MSGPTMGEADRRAIVWDAIERMAFKPASDNEMRKWLSVYARSLPDLWELQGSDLQIRYDRGYLAGFAVPVLAIDCQCCIEGSDKYTVTLFKTTDSTQTVLWHLHVDPGFPSRQEYCGSSAKYPQQDEAKCLDEDIRAVLDGMLFHPRNHAHAEDLGVRWADGHGCSALSTHEVRLGGAVENAFVFLAHLRFQFCLLSGEVRETERRRLKKLFHEAMVNDTQSIAASDLLDFRYSCSTLA